MEVTTIYGKPVKRGKHVRVKMKCPYCSLEHTLAEGQRVPPCNSQFPEYIIKPHIERI